MQAYLGNQDVTLTIPLINDAGEVIVASAVEYRVIDEAETALVAKTALASFTSGDAEVTVVIPASINDLGVAARALRMVELFVTGEQGIVKLSSEYVIEASSVIAVGINSLQTYPSAVLLAYELPNLPGWNAASKTDRMNALAAAYRNLGKLCLRYVSDDADNMTRVVTPAEWGSSNITDLNAGQLATLPAKYLESLRRAQVYEADFMLGGDEVGDIRRAGIMSATVGESSQFFRTQKPLEGFVCKRAMKELAGYLSNRVSVGRG